MHELKIRPLTGEKSLRRVAWFVWLGAAVSAATLACAVVTGWGAACMAQQEAASARECYAGALKARAEVVALLSERRCSMTSASCEPAEDKVESAGATSLAAALLASGVPCLREHLQAAWCEFNVGLRRMAADAASPQPTPGGLVFEAETAGDLVVYPCAYDAPLNWLPSMNLSTMDTAPWVRRCSRPGCAQD